MKPPIYLDHAATSWPKPVEVGAEITRTLSALTANAGRSGHHAAVDAARLVFDTRQRLADLMGVADAANVVFVRGCTEGLNLVLKGALKRGDRVAVSPMEHNAVMRPLSRLIAERGIVVETLAADPRGRIDWDAARRTARDSPPDLVVVQHASNVNGVVQDLVELRRTFADSRILLDAAQTLGVLPLDVGQLGIDFVAASVHKGLLGPTGVGVVYLAPDAIVAPLIEGGTGSRSESLEQPDFRPDCYEAGTLNLHGIAGTRGALQRLPERGLLGEHKRRLAARLIDGLRSIHGVHVQSPADGTALCVSFGVDGLQPDEVATKLERGFGILCRPGLHCAPAAHGHLGTLPQGTIRLSPGWGNTVEQIDVALRAVDEIVRKRKS
ncbi:MAG: aminotransferase class V-fold PLP-dependent enzyme [Planctomycetes bacterium]|nr:aminotransferase class V-fold PLP-dependent enzyme [Planctomycetota bacterium]